MITPLRAGLRAGVRADLRAEGLQTESRGNLGQDCLGQVLASRATRRVVPDAQRYATLLTTLLLFAALMTGCAEIGDTSTDRVVTSEPNRPGYVADGSLEMPIEHEDISDVVAFHPTTGFWTESEGIGSSWFYYFSGVQHALAPKPITYMIQKVDADSETLTCDLAGDLSESLFVRFVSYTNLDLVEGYLLFELEKLGGVKKQFQVPTSLFDGPVCFDFAKFEEGQSDNLFFPCESYAKREGFFIFSAPERAIVTWDGRFEMPTIQVGGEEKYRVSRLNTDSLANLSIKTSCETIRDINYNVTESRIASAVDGKIQTTIDRDFDISTWQFDRETEDITYMCGDARFPSPFANSDIKSLSLRELISNIRLAQTTQIVAVRLCGDGGEDEKLELLDFDFWGDAASYGHWLVQRTMKSYTVDKRPTFYVFVRNREGEKDIVFQLAPGVTSMTQKAPENGVAPLMEAGNSAFESIRKTDFKALEIPFIFHN